MRTIARIFAKSPFTPLQTHMEKVTSCVIKLRELFSAFSKGKGEDMKRLAKKISKLEYEADLTKHDLRNHLQKSLFLPVKREDLLEILHIQDSIADICEHIGITLTMTELQIPDWLKKDFFKLVEKSLETFEKTHLVSLEVDNIIESSFGGMEAEKVKSMIEEVAFLEHEQASLKYSLMRELYKHAESMKHYIFNLWLSLLEEISRLSKLSEHLANHIRMILDVT